MRTPFGLQRHHWGWLLTGAAIALIFLRPLYDLAQLALSRETYSHIALIPLIYLFLIGRLRSDLGSPPKVPIVPVAGLVFLSLVTTAAGWWFHSELGRVDHLTVMMLAFIPALWASSLVYFGATGFRATLFPQLFLLFLAPIPLELLDVMIQALLWGSALVTDLLFRVSGLPFFRQDYVFVLPGLTIEIAKECSGIRSTMALVITGLLAGYLSLRTGWGKLVLVAALFPLAVFKNGLRIVTLSLLSIHVDEGFMEGDLHTRGGVVFFCVTLAVMGALIWGIGRLEQSSTRVARD